MCVCVYIISLIYIYTINMLILFYIVYTFILDFLIDVAIIKIIYIFN